MANDNDILFCKIAVIHGLITREQAVEVLPHISDNAGQLLVERGYLTESESQSIAISQTETLRQIGLSPIEEVSGDEKDHLLGNDRVPIIVGNGPNKKLLAGVAALGLCVAVAIAMLGRPQDALNTDPPSPDIAQSAPSDLPSRPHPEPTLEAMITALDDTDPSIRTAARDQLAADTDTPRTVALLLDRLSDPRPVGRLHAIELLGAIGSGTDVTDALAALADEDALVTPVLIALRAQGEYGEQQASQIEERHRHTKMVALYRAAEAARSERDFELAYNHLEQIHALAPSNRQQMANAWEHSKIDFDPGYDAYQKEIYEQRQLSRGQVWMNGEWVGSDAARLLRSNAFRTRYLNQIREGERRIADKQFHEATKQFQSVVGASVGTDMESLIGNRLKDIGHLVEIQNSLRDAINNRQPKLQHPIGFDHNQAVTLLSADDSGISFGSNEEIQVIEWQKVRWLDYCQLARAVISQDNLQGQLALAALYSEAGKGLDAQQRLEQASALDTDQLAATEIARLSAHATVVIALTGETTASPEIARQVHNLLDLALSALHQEKLNIAFAYLEQIDPYKTRSDYPVVVAAYRQVPNGKTVLEQIDEIVSRRFTLFAEELNPLIDRLLETYQLAKENPLTDPLAEAFALVSAVEKHRHDAQYDQVLARHPSAQRVGNLQELFQTIQTGYYESNGHHLFEGRWYDLREVTPVTDSPLWNDGRQKQSTFYTVQTDVGIPFLFDCCDQLDRLFERHQDLFKYPHTDRLSVTVKLFRTEDAYRAYARSHGVDRSDPAGVNQYYSPADNEIVTFYDEADPYGSLFRAAARHATERFSRASETALPFWFIEGVVDYFGYYRMEENQLVAGLPAMSVRTQLWEKVSRGEQIPFAELFKASNRDSFDSLHRMESWGILYYLLHGGDGTRSLFRSTLNPVRSGEQDNNAFEKKWVHWALSTESPLAPLEKVESDG